MYGYPVTMPMEIPPEVYRSDFAPPIPGLTELPEIIDARTNGLRLQGTSAKALPGMADVGSMTNVREMEAAEYANDIRAAFAISREYDKRSKLIAKEKNRRMERAAKKFGVR